MSFICDVCGKSAPEGTRCTLVPIKKREHIHPYRHAAKIVKREDGKKDFAPDEGGKGVQTKKEVKACISCVPRAQAMAGSIEIEPAPPSANS